jgi:hypothetical protein
MCFQHDLTFNIYNKGDYDFEYSDMGYCQEESLLSPDITTNQLSLVTSDMVTTNQDSEKLKMNAFQQGNEEQRRKGDCKCILYISSTLNDQIPLCSFMILCDR